MGRENKMRNIVILVAIVFSFFANFAFAGGGGGTVLPGAKFVWNADEIVRHIWEDDGNIYFQYGQKDENNKWIFKDIIMPEYELRLDQPAFKAIENSKFSRDWWEISN